ncbi:DUF3085 domain-containing protein [Paraburkholderia silvatlantica]|uniref:DUF3085 domain-containing protein n=1 Tax=Paraburkholderia silvatlantica TaxID=321895 RepID=UPI00374FDEA3
MIHFLTVDLLPILTYARQNHCRVVLVKDHGVYMMAEKPGPGERRNIAFAVECNPELLQFDVWWNRTLLELGGDDFVEYLDAYDAIFERVIEDGWNLEVQADARLLYIDAVRPVS